MEITEDEFLSMLDWLYEVNEDYAEYLSKKYKVKCVYDEKSKQYTLGF